MTGNDHWFVRATGLAGAGRNQFRTDKKICHNSTSVTAAYAFCIVNVRANGVIFKMDMRRVGIAKSSLIT